MTNALLQTQLDAFKASLKGNIPDVTLAMMNEENELLRTSGILNSCIKAGDKLPPFSLKNQNDEPISSNVLLSKGGLVVSFFRGIWCPYCNLEVKALSEQVDAFAELGFTLLAISPQRAQYAAKSIRDNNLDFDVLVDEGNAYANKLGIVFTLSNRLREIYNGFKLDLPEYNDDDSWSLPMPTRLVVSKDDEVINTDINPDYTQRPEPTSTLDIVRQHLST